MAQFPVKNDAVELNYYNALTNFLFTAAGEKELTSCSEQEIDVNSV